MRHILIRLCILILTLATGPLACGKGTETGNPTTSTTGNSEGDSGTTASPASDNDVSALPNVSVGSQFIETLAQGDDADLSFEESVTFFDNEDAFSNAWEELTGALDPVPEKPEVDFDTRIIAIAIMGVREGDGYSVAITGQHIEDSILILTVTQTFPGENCGQSDTTNNPYVIVSVPTASYDVTWETETMIENCE